LSADKLKSTCAHGRRKGGMGNLGPLGFENFSRKGLFFSFEWEQKFSALFPPPYKNLWKKPPMPPWKQSFWRPCLYTVWT